MRNVRLWRALLGVDQRTVIEDIEFEEFEEEAPTAGTLVVARVRPRVVVSRRCGRCGRRRPGMTGARVGGGGGVWIGARWGAAGGRRAAGELPRARRRWWRFPGRARAGHTWAFDDTVAWLAACSKTAVCELMRVAWRTVGAIVARVGRRAPRVDRFAGCAGSGSTRSPTSGTTVSDRGGRSRQRPAGVGRARPRHGDPAAFFDALGADRCGQISLCRRRRGLDRRVVAARCPPRSLYRPVPRGGLGHRRPRCRAPPGVERRPGAGPDEPKGAGPTRQDTGHACPAAPAKSRAPATRCGRTPRTSPTARRPSWPGSPPPTRLYRAYLLKEGLRHVFAIKGEDGKQALDAWLSWAPAAASPRSSSCAGRICDTARHRRRPRPRPVPTP